MTIASLLLAVAGSLSCRVVTDDVIRMKDLATVAPVFDRIDPETVAAYSPLPGAVRVLQAAQLARLARQHGIRGGEFEDICFQRAMRLLQEHELLEAFRQALAIPSAEVELVDFSRFPAPVGDLVFPRSGLGRTGTGGPLLWKGYVAYGKGSHFAIWARVRVRARLNRVVATGNLVAGKPVALDQIRIEPLDGVPDTLAPAQSIEQVAGKTLLRPVRQGSSISLDDLSSAVVIHRGDKVDVDFESLSLRLRFEASAEMDGRIGESIRLRNLQSSNTFMAEVFGRNQARVRPGEGK
jgi:flagella basal body P-ring formation protein FlgA